MKYVIPSRKVSKSRIYIYIYSNFASIFPQAGVNFENFDVAEEPKLQKKRTDVSFVGLLECEGIDMFFYIARFNALMSLQDRVTPIQNP